MISVIIPTYRDWETMSNCLEQLKRQTLSADSFEVIVVNNDPKVSPPKSLEFAENVQLLSEAKPGSYAARNTGIRYSTGEILAFTDSDCLPHATWLEEVYKELFSNEGIDLIGGDIQVFRLSKGDTSAYLFERHYGFKQRMNVERYGKSVTANLIVRKKVFDELGLFDESAFSGEDNRWTSMAVSKGYRIKYSPLIQVSHPARLTLAELILKRKRTIGGYYKLHYQSLSFSAKVKSHFIAALAPIKTIMSLQNASAIERMRVLMIKWRIEWAAFWELINLRRKRKEELRT